MDSRETECPECQGTGVKIVTAAYLDRIDEHTLPCPECRGSGVKQVEPLNEEAEIASP
jgi:DnaJ-class molecular chaperone